MRPSPDMFNLARPVREIARYGTLKTWAGELGHNQAVKLLEQTLSEEKRTDEILSQLAESEVNQHAQAA
jgi:ferritin-like metal-binding protein YciE